MLKCIKFLYCISALYYCIVCFAQFDIARMLTTLCMSSAPILSAVFVLARMCTTMRRNIFLAAYVLATNSTPFYFFLLLVHA